MKQYLDKTYKNFIEKNKNESVFIQAVEKFIHSIKPYLNENKDIIKYNIIERLIEPDRVIIFNVPWVNDKNEIICNRGYRVQFNNLLGPYKGGIRFSSSVDLSIVKFLGFMQTLKNALTTLPLGGAKGGSDFDPKGKSEFEIMRFCQSFINELYKYIGPYKDIPAGDLGCGSLEVSYMFNHYKKLTNNFNGTFTSKNVLSGGSLGRKEATGFGLVYFASRMIEVIKKESLKNKIMIISGSGNVGLHALEKATSLGAIVTCMSDTSGYIYNQKGINFEILKKIKEEKLSVKEYLKYQKDTVFIHDPKKMWDNKCDIALPCATQNEIDLSDVINLTSKGCYLICEGANMPLTNSAISYLLDNNILYAPAIASNCGGVMVSGFEMSQNSSFSKWMFEEVDSLLKNKMKTIFDDLYLTSEKYGHKLDLNTAAYIKSFEILSNAMINSGV